MFLYIPEMEETSRLTNPPLHMGDTLWASHTSALILEMMPRTTLRTPRKIWIPEMTYTDAITALNIANVCSWLP